MEHIYISTTVAIQSTSGYTARVCVVHACQREECGTGRSVQSVTDSSRIAPRPYGCSSSPPAHLLTTRQAWMLSVSHHAPLQVADDTLTQSHSIVQFILHFPHTQSSPPRACCLSLSLSCVRSTHCRAHYRLSPDTILQHDGQSEDDGATVDSTSRPPAVRLCLFVSPVCPTVVDCLQMRSVASTVTSARDAVSDKLAKPLIGETVAQYLCRYLRHLGVRRIFTVPGDFTLPLMHDMESHSLTHSHTHTRTQKHSSARTENSDRSVHLLAVHQPSFTRTVYIVVCVIRSVCGTGLTASPPLPFILGLNELNSGYSADAYARLAGFSVLMVTFSVGSLSAINAIAGMYAENVPCLVLVGSLNSNSPAEGEIVHHTLGEQRYDYSLRMAKEVTVHSSIILRACDTPRLLHEAVEQCLTHRKPVYVEIGTISRTQCNSTPYPLLSSHVQH